MTDAPAFLSPISEEIWRRKYRLTSDAARDETLADTFRRVAEAAASVEKGGKRVRDRWARRFYEAMSDFGFVPAGRILAGAGTGRAVTLFNCFVMGRIEDDLGSIFENVKEAALTMQQGGGIGHDFSTLRPKGALVRSIGADASGPVSFMDVWDAMCRTIMSAGARRGAMMGTLRCDHPDIEAFIDAKSDPLKLRNFNLSVLVTNAFIAAVRAGKPWDLVFDGKVVKTIEARALWDRIMRAAYDYAEPGVIFIDRINRQNNLSYCEEIRATNPCGEQPLPPYGACLLGSINLAEMVREQFAKDAALDLTRLEERTRIAVRFLDNVVDISGYPLAAQRQEAKAKRRIGLGVTGLADALIALGVRYGSPEAERLAESWMGAIERAAYLASAELAAEKGAFPLYDAEQFLAAPNLQRLPAEVQDAIRRHGIRNGCLTSIAPTGTISLFAGNVSSGVEPVFDFRYARRVLDRDGNPHVEEVEDLAHARYRRVAGNDAPLTPAFVKAADLTPREHLVMQAALQRHVDSSISKTINCQADISFEAFQSIYLEAFDLGLKGCTAYRPNTVTGAVLSAIEAPAATPDESTVTIEPLHVAPAPAAPPGTAGAAPSGHGGVIYMAKPLDRDPVLAGYTYKLKWPESDHALYVTLNDIETNGRRRPFEIFINTRNLEHYAWTVALTRMISAVFRRGGDVAFVAEELKAVFDPQGGRWMGGRYVPSLLAAIGEVIEAHMKRIGFLSDPDGVSELPLAPPVAVAHGGEENAALRSGSRPLGRSCPRCAAQAFVKEEGCWTCRACGFSRCD
ncbi:adenosylcobalamin-dependent ribonucleoside-diphosphate reductase [Hyphomicrobium sp. CS1GBMeth3]|uniref:adenosylcobalamin-dependent ribonucleoside-diphosphate reductase n=1 Tax=Hyphomicrobium sp. CS1GBMeth3 TaxID=1892845 RepID=UPI000931114F|nr:adenosylcobalamin-dependent ribonucleoside-diphosphate reductase [Hyphomicrobium sp. CS1GBMeth3]